VPHSSTYLFEIYSGFSMIYTLLTSKMEIAFHCNTICETEKRSNFVSGIRLTLKSSGIVERMRSSPTWVTWNFWPLGHMIPLFDISHLFIKSFSLDMLLGQASKSIMRVLVYYVVKLILLFSFIVACINKSLCCCLRVVFWSTINFCHMSFSTWVYAISNALK